MKNIEEIVKTRQPGKPLPQAFYENAEIFSAELETIFPTLWLLVDHQSRIPKTGDYFLFDLGRDQIILIRDKQGEVRAFYNSCRHRGSVVCTEKEGNASLLVCPYHAWSYNLNGKLRTAPYMAADFDKAGYGLKPCHVRLSEGFIFINTSRREPPDFDDFIKDLAPFIAAHGLGGTKIAAKRNFPTDANWKLVVENFFECYHCKPSHHTYCRVHEPAKILALGAGPGSSSAAIPKKLQDGIAAWEKKAAKLGLPSGLLADGPESCHFRQAARLPIREGFMTETLDGRPAAPLLGFLPDYDGGQTACSYNPLGTLLISNDFAVMIRFTPRGPLSSDVEATWLVREDAVEGRDYDLRNLMELWLTTLGEDKIITENNQKGIASSRYEPGVYSMLEKRIDDFQLWYLRKMSDQS